MENTKKKEILRAIKFLLFSISAGVIQIGSYAFIRLFISQYPEGSWQDYVIAYTPSLLLSVIWNFTFNRKYTFKSANNVKVAMLLVLAFYAVFAPGSIIAGGALVAGGAHPDLIMVLTMLANFVLEFIYTRLFVYRNSLDTAVKKVKAETAVSEENLKD